MEKEPGYIKHVDLIGKAEFIRLFTTELAPEAWFTEKELQAYTLHRNSGSLAARYLIKRRICEQIGGQNQKSDIEILNNSSGKPEIQFGENIRCAMERAGISRIICSISHSRNYITGMTIFILNDV